MAVSNLDFASTVDDWCRQSEARMTAIFRESSQRLASIAVNGVPVDTGFARASIRASTDSMPPINPTARGVKGQTYEPNDEISAVIASAELSDTLFIGFTASYIGFLEWGHSNQAPQGFVRLAAAQWDSIVSQVVVEAKARAG